LTKARTATNEISADRKNQFVARQLRDSQATPINLPTAVAADITMMVSDTPGKSLTKSTMEK
jgi:hypothetical protein